MTGSCFGMRGEVMLNLLSVKPLLITTAIFLTTTLLLSWAVHTLNESKQLMATQLLVERERNSTLAVALKKQVLECKIADSLVVEMQEQKEVLEKEKEGVLAEIEAMQPKTLCKTPHSKMHTQTSEAVNDEIDIDSPLPSELVRVLDKAFSGSGK